jgi:hypothetical protein
MDLGHFIDQVGLLSGRVLQRELGITTNWPILTDAQPAVLASAMVSWQGFEYMQHRRALQSRRRRNTIMQLSVHAYDFVYGQGQGLASVLEGVHTNGLIGDGTVLVDADPIHYAPWFQSTIMLHVNPHMKGDSYPKDPLQMIAQTAIQCVQRLEGQGYLWCLPEARDGRQREPIFSSLCRTVHQRQYS